jgi:hypothetical protein
MRSILLAAACATAVVAGPALGQTQGRTSAELSGGIEYQEGDYGTGQSVRTLTARTALRVERGGLILFASLPYVRLEAPGNVVGGAGLVGLPIIIDPTQPATRDVREGLGDLRLGGGYRLPQLSGFDFALSGEAKLPTAAAGLGTGETDVSLSAEAARTIGHLTPFVTLSYTVPGNPDAYELRDSFSARGGLTARLSDNLRGSIVYGYAQSLSPLIRDEQEISTGLEFGISRRLSLGLEGSAGLSEGAADLGAGVRIGWRVF